MRLRLVLAFSGLAALMLEPCPARAEPVDALLLAQQAYNDVEFEKQRDEATRALEAGQNDRERLAQIYRLLGIAHAALEAPDRAKQAFMKLLAIDPDVALEHVLSPRLRTPYMEARGFWDVASTRLTVQATVDDRTSALRVTVSDPLSMGALVRVRTGGEAASVVAEAAPTGALVVERSRLEPYVGAPLVVELLDPHDNVLVVRALPPVRAAAGRDRPARGKPLPHAPEQEASEVWPVLPAVLGGAALLAVGVGAYAHVRRENSADEWNGASCERAGLGTREQQCGPIDRERRAAQDTATVAYAVGGGLLVAGVVAYLTAGDDAPPSGPRAQSSCGAGPATLGVSCTMTW